MQLGKNGLTEGFISGLKDHFSKSRTVKISVLRSARENKDDVKRIAKEINEKLGEFYTTKVVGFTITVKKWRKPKVSFKYTNL